MRALNRSYDFSNIGDIKATKTWTKQIMVNRLIELARIFMRANFPAARCARDGSQRSREPDGAVYHAWRQAESLQTSAGGESAADATRHSLLGASQ